MQNYHLSMKVYKLNFFILLIKWEMFKYLYLDRSEIQNRFMKVDFFHIVDKMGNI